MANSTGSYGVSFVDLVDGAVAVVGVVSKTTSSRISTERRHTRITQTLRRTCRILAIMLRN